MKLFEQRPIGVVKDHSQADHAGAETVFREIWRASHADMITLRGRYVIIKKNSGLRRRNSFFRQQSLHPGKFSLCLFSFFAVYFCLKPGGFGFQQYELAIFLVEPQPGCLQTHVSSLPLADPKSELLTPHPAAVVSLNQLIASFLQSPASQPLSIRIAPEILRRPESPFVERLLDGFVHHSRSRRKKFYDEIGIFADFVPNRPVFSVASSFHFLDEEEIGPFVILFFRLAPTVINEHVAADEIVV